MKKKLTLLIATLIFVEIILHLIFGISNVIVPIKNKIINGTHITVPVFQNGVISGYEPPLEKKLRSKIGRILKMFYQGFSLKELNKGYEKLRGYRTGLSIYEGSAFIPYVRKPGVKREFGVDKPATFTTDENGFFVFPSSENLPEIKILMMGGSTTDSPYPFYLWKFLNAHSHSFSYEVINQALASYTTADNLAAFTFRGINYQPNIIIVYQAFNDLFPHSMPEHGSVEFKADYSHWRSPYKENLANEFKFFDHIPRFFNVSAIYSLIRNLILSNGIQKFDHGIWGVTTNYVPNKPNLKVAGEFEAYRNNLKRINFLAESVGAKLIFVTQLHQPKLGRKEEYIMAEKMNDIMRELAKKLENVVLIEFSNTHKDQVDKLMVRDMVHFDEPGYEALGNFIGKNILAIHPSQ